MIPILKTEKLSKLYQHRDGPVNALKDISLAINKGDFVTITGSSGSGKTTLLLALSGLIKPTSGSIHFFEKEITGFSDREMSQYRQENVGFIMQNFSLVPYMSALQNTLFPLILNGHSNKEQIGLATSALKTVGLDNRMNHFPRELSAGQQQRVAIARAIVNKPAIIFADEPTGNLDPALAIEILEMLQHVNRQEAITIIMVTHSPQAAEYGNITINLRDGEVLETFRVEQISGN